MLNPAQDFERSLEKEIKSPVFKGAGRILFLTLAITLMMQGLSLIHVQLNTVSGVLSSDFKILLTLSTDATPALVNEMGSALTSASGVTSLKFISAQDAFEVLKGSKPDLASKFVFLGRNPMPEYFEIKLTPAATANIENWVAEHITTPFPGSAAHYKPEQAALVAYTSAMARFFNFLNLLALALFASFIFYVEAYFHKGDCARAGGITVSVLAYGAGLLIIYALTHPLMLLGGRYWDFTTPARQIIIFLTTALLGWTFAKWKKF